MDATADELSVVVTDLEGNCGAHTGDSAAVGRGWIVAPGKTWGWIEAG